MYIEIGDKLYDLVSGLIGTTDIAFVYNNEKKLSTDGFPFVSILPSSATEIVFDNPNNVVDIGYNINIYVRNKDIETNEQTIRGIVDSVLVALRDDQYLTGSALKSIYDVERGFIDSEQPIRVATIKVTYTLLIKI